MAFPERRNAKEWEQGAGVRLDVLVLTVLGLVLAGGEFVKLQDERHSCLTCLDSVVVDTADCQPLYNDVLAFYHSMSMPLPVQPPLMLVESSALNEAEGREGRERRQVWPPVVVTQAASA